jgi:hypothetical protein
LHNLSGKKLSKIKGIVDTEAEGMILVLTVSVPEVQSTPPKELFIVAKNPTQAMGNEVTVCEFVS